MSNANKAIHTYAAGDVQWDQRLCIHVGECGRAQGDLFVGGRDPWCQPDVASNDNVADVVKRCPWGALTLERKDGGPAETPEAENVIVVSNNGPKNTHSQRSLIVNN
ncbi:MAG: (4Fe-4S)-binding protein [Myxococcaceae bacterium]